MFTNLNERGYNRKLLMGYISFSKFNHSYVFKSMIMLVFSIIKAHQFFTYTLTKDEVDFVSFIVV